MHEELEDFNLKKQTQWEGNAYSFALTNFFRLCFFQ